MAVNLVRVDVRRLIPFFLLAAATAFFMLDKGELAGVSLILGVVTSLID